MSAFATALPDWTVLATSRDPEDTRRRHGVEAVPARPDHVARALGRADAFVVGGGTLFKELHPSTGRHPDALLANAVALAGAARARGIDVALLGVGASPLRRPTSRWLGRRLVSLSDVLVLRDTGSAGCLEDIGLVPPFRVGGDPAWTVLDDVVALEPRDGVVVALSHLAGQDDDLTTWMAAALWELAADAPVSLLPWQDAPGDHRLAGRLQEVLGERVSVLDPPADLQQAAAVLARHDLAISLRFHALVAAAAAATPTVALAHEPKLGSLAERLDQPAVLPSQSPPALVEAARVARRRGPADPAVVARERGVAHDTLGLLRVYLGGGPPPGAHLVPTLDLEPMP